MHAFLDPGCTSYFSSLHSGHGTIGIAQPGGAISGEAARAYGGCDSNELATPCVYVPDAAHA